MTYAQINELLNYGTDAQCRAMLEAIANLMHDYGVKDIEEAFEIAKAAPDELEDERQNTREAEDNYDDQLRAYHRISDIAARLADALVDLMTVVKAQPVPAKINTACNKALDAWELEY